MQHLQPHIHRFNFNLFSRCVSASFERCSNQILYHFSFVAKQPTVITFSGLFWYFNVFHRIGSYEYWGEFQHWGEGIHSQRVLGIEGGHPLPFMCNYLCHSSSSSRQVRLTFALLIFHMIPFSAFTLAGCIVLWEVPVCFFQCRLSLSLILRVQYLFPVPFLLPPAHVSASQSLPPSASPRPGSCPTPGCSSGTRCNHSHRN